MFEQYLQDAYSLFCLANTPEKKLSDQEIKRYLRASIFYSASAMEAFVNYIGDSFEKGESLSENEIAFLNDKQFIFDPGKGKLISQIRYYSIEDKVKFLIHKFSPKYDFGKSKAWINYLDFKKFRDSLVHPKHIDDEITIDEYIEKIKKGMFGTITLMNDISKSIFRRPLRKQLLDLIPT